MTADGVRCQNPKCRAKLAESLKGELVVTCRKCGWVQTIVVQIAPGEVKVGKEVSVA